MAAVLLAVVLSMPLAQLFELGGASIWAPALLHFVVQGTVKIVVFSSDSASQFPLVWMAASAVIPMFAMMVSRRCRISVCSRGQTRTIS